MDAELNLADRRQRAWERHCMMMQLIADKEEVSLERLDAMIAAAKHEASKLTEEDVWDHNM